MAERLCIIGGGAAGVGTMWTLAKGGYTDIDVTLIDFRDQLGGHALTKTVNWNGNDIPVDTGVQFFIPLMYPNISKLTKLPGIADKVPTVAYDDLRVACAFPQVQGSAMNWGNFPAYQSGPAFEMYTEAMRADAVRFQDFMDVSLLEGWAGKTLQTYLDERGSTYEDIENFTNYFLFPYLSIINGYGAALTDQVKFEDLFPLFAHVPGLWPGLGSFTQPGQGYQRFVNGASSLIQAMYDDANSLQPANLMLNTAVDKVIPSSAPGGPVTVVYTPQGGSQTSAQFDQVVITTDMTATRTMLDIPENQSVWSELYAKYLSADDWQLLPGQCFIHHDESVLSPDLRDEEETLQFTAYYAADGTKPGGYDMFKTYTTYIQKNLHDNVDASGVFNTMYGYIPDPAVDKVPDPAKTFYKETWMHGMWLPTFMMPAKKALHNAQPPGNSLSYPGQRDTNVFFAGNNTTADSLEMAFLSGAIIANYAWGAPYPLDSLLGFGMYELFYKEFMFPAALATEKYARRGEGHKLGQ